MYNCLHDQDLLELYVRHQRLQPAAPLELLPQIPKGKLELQALELQVQWYGIAYLTVYELLIIFNISRNH